MPEIRALFEGCHVQKVSSASGMVTKKGGSDRVMNVEVLITNFEPEAERSYSHTSTGTPLFQT